ncbi:MAG: hypothetical protein NVSMB62_10980 [Acidobacteriaceae bacterium]
MRRGDEGLPKLWTIHRALSLRREHRDWFGEGAAYQPLRIKGKMVEHGIAYLRGESVATVVPRLPLTLAGRWEDTAVELPAGRWTNHFTGELVRGGRVLLADLLRRFPVALLVRD